MAFQLLLNFFLAFLWMFLSGSFTAATFIIGFFLGAVIVFAFRRSFKERYYMTRVVAIIRLTLQFIWELIVANFQVVALVMKPKMDIQPGIFKYETSLTKNWEITLLSLLITLTPGTLVVEVEDDNKYLYIHALNVPDVKDAVSSIKNGFERLISEVSR